MFVSFDNFRTCVNEIGQRRRAYKGNKPKRDINIFTLAAAYRLREARSQEERFKLIWNLL
jgi:hypothetical protein